MREAFKDGEGVLLKDSAVPESGQPATSVIDREKWTVLVGFFALAIASLVAIIVVNNGLSCIGFVHTLVIEDTADFVFVDPRLSVPSSLEVCHDEDEARTPVTEQNQHENQLANANITLVKLCGILCSVSEHSSEPQQSYKTEEP
jgi:hypothetical protein